MDTHFTSPAANGGSHHLRFHLPHRHLSPVFGNDWFALKAEAFARFFGTPFFLVGQTLVVAIWIFLNAAQITHFDLYPFILLNLAFSTQAAYADADAQHREALASASEEREVLAGAQTARLLELMQQNTDLTELIKQLSERIEVLTAELHGQLCRATK